MPNRKLERLTHDRRTVVKAPYEIGYFARKHGISREQAKELFRKIGTIAIN